jgi:DNA polymerase III sliding clamp (beta) subunit (PCNA family)
VRLLPEGRNKFKLLENHWMQITSDRRTYKMVGMAKDNFPSVPEFPHPLVKIPAKILSSLIAKTAFAISMEESRYTLNGALLILKPDTITVVATDGHRLAVAETDHSFAGLSERGAHPGAQKSVDAKFSASPGGRGARPRSNSRATTAICFFQ